MPQPIPKDLSQEAMLFLFQTLLALLEDKKILTNGEFLAELALRSNEAKKKSPSSTADEWSPSAISEASRVVAWLRDRQK